MSNQNEKTATTSWLSLREIATGVIATLLASGIYALYGFFAYPNQTAGQAFSAFVFVLVAVILIAVPVAKWLVKGPLMSYARPRITNDVKAEVLQHFEQDLNVRSGILRIYSGFQKCEPEIKQQLETSKRIDFFLQIGKTVLSGGNDFYDYLENARLRENARVRVLHADGRSAYLTERVARERGSNLATWRDDLRNAANKARTLQLNHEQRVEARQHREGYVWRIFIFDEQAFAQPYLFAHDNGIKAPVLQLSRLGPDGTENDVSLYGVFSRYFDLKWDEYRPNSSSLAKLVAPDEVLSVAAMIEHRDVFLFVVPNRYITREDEEVPFHCVGGKPMDGESLLEALQREAGEETGVALDVLTSTTTRYVTTLSEQAPMVLDDNPAPYAIYKRNRSRDPNVEDPDVIWLIGYRAQVHGTAKPTPGAEVGAVIGLTRAALAQTLDGMTSFRDIQRMTDGSYLNLHDGVSLDVDRIAVPTGLATIVAVGERHNVFD